MKNQYVGDIGDYGKYGLLRFLANRGIHIGINWYLTNDDGSKDGKFTKYLEKPENRIYDSELFDVLKDIAFREDKTVQMIEEKGIIPNAVYYSENITCMDKNYAQRKANRQLWFEKSTIHLQDSELIFADPDNGISYRKKATAKSSEKYVLPEEIAEYYSMGKDVVYYCHKGRRKPDAWEQAKVEILKYIQNAMILVMTFHRGTQRSYIFVVHPEKYKKYEQMLMDFEKTEWIRNKAFSKDGVLKPYAG